MVDRSLVRELLGGIQERLLHERLAHAMSRAVAEREFAFELAGLIEEHVRDVVAIPPWTAAAGTPTATVGDVDLLVLPRRSAVHRKDGTLAPPRVWPAGTLAIELSEIRLASGVGGSSGYDAILAQLRTDLADKSAARPSEEPREASWLGLTVMTDAAWSDTPASVEGRRIARDVRVDRWRPCPPGLLCIGSVFGSMAYRAWRGDVWVEAFIQAPATSSPPSRESIRLAPSERVAGKERWYARHGSDGRQLDGDAFGPAHLRVETATLHEHRRDQYERLGSWGGTFEELRLCLFMEERLANAHHDGAAFEEVPGVAQLIRELSAAWDAPAV